MGGGERNFIKKLLHYTHITYLILTCGKITESKFEIYKVKMLLQFQKIFDLADFVDKHDMNNIRHAEELTRVS